MINPLFLFYFIGVTGKRERERESLFWEGIIRCAALSLTQTSRKTFFFSRRNDLEKNPSRKFRTNRGWTLFEARFWLARTWRFSSRVASVGPFVSLQLTDSNKRRGRVSGQRDGGEIVVGASTRSQNRLPTGRGYD